MNKIIIISLSLLLSACASTSTEKNPETTNLEKEADGTVESRVQDLAGEAISLSLLNDKVFLLESIDGGKPPVKENLASVSFSHTDSFGDIVRGNTGCNLYFTKYKTLRSLLITDRIITTDDKCSRDKMKLEDFFFKIYSQRPIILIEKDTLIMKTPTNKLIFREQIEKENEVKN